MSAPQGVLLARLANLLESAWLEAPDGSRCGDYIKQARELLEVIQG